MFTQASSYSNVWLRIMGNGDCGLVAPVFLDLLLIRKHHRLVKPRKLQLHTRRFLHTNHKGNNVNIVAEVNDMSCFIL